MSEVTCLSCNSTRLLPIYSQSKTPVSIGCTLQPHQQDQYKDIEYSFCRSCGCTQIINPVDRELLYKESHNNTYSTPTWALHHKEFSDFILSNALSDDFLEIGGSPGVLAKLIKAKKPRCKYAILDLCDSDPNIENLTYIQANCEDYTYVNRPTLLLSHVFEHLYNPLFFLQNISKGNIPEVFISIPNMKVSLERKSLSFLHIEHIYYIDSNLIISMFSKYGFACKKTLNFKDHSLFFHFIQSNSSLDNELTVENINESEKLFRSYFEKRDLVFQSLEIPLQFFIVPSGHFGQYMYMKLQKYKENMIGFLDNDPSKIGKRLYGTHLTIYKMNEISKYDKIGVVIHAGPYLEEIKKQLLEYNPNITFYDV